MKEKDQSLFLETVLKVFLFLFGILIILRILKIGDFSFELENEQLKMLASIIYHNYGSQFITLFTSCFIMYQLICKNPNLKKQLLVTFLVTTLNILTQILLANSNLNLAYSLLSIIILLLGIYAIDKKIHLIRTIVVFAGNILYQNLILFVRNITLKTSYSEVCDFLLQFDYLILLIIIYTINLLRRKNKIDHQKFFKSNLLSKFKKQKNNHIKSQKIERTLEEKRERVSNIIYSFLYLIWNFFTLGTVIFVCTLNTTLITTIFLLSSFMLTKTVFGPAFHMKRALSCFIVSNLVYFALSRITVSIHISFLVPIILGVGLSYVSSLLTRDKNQPTSSKKENYFYKGMTEEEFMKISKDSPLNEYEIQLLKDFYCKRMTLLQLSLKYNYSKDTIYYHKKKATEKIKKFNK